MKIAIIHNFMDHVGGAEKVTLTLARGLNAHVITTNIDRKAIKDMGFENIKLISIGKVPVDAPYRQQRAALLFRFKKLPKYDFYIVSGDWAMSAVVKNKPSLWYVHSPIREIWDLYNDTRKNKVMPHQRYIFDLWVYFNRSWNRRYIKHTNVVCNSINTQKRLKKYLKTSAEVINPPIEVNDYKYKKNGDYWLSVNRLIDHKRVELQMMAFKDLPNEKLIIVGSYEKSKHFMRYVDFLMAIKPKNVEIQSFVNYKDLIDLYSNCKGFITTSQDEDFGMTPVEAMASGKPVVAVNEGGYKETIIEGKTGYLVEPRVSLLVNAIKKVSKNPKKYHDDCITQANIFSTAVFIDKINKKMHDIINKGR